MYFAEVVATDSTPAVLAFAAAAAIAADADYKPVAAVDSTPVADSIAAAVVAAPEDNKADSAAAPCPAAASRAAAELADSTAAAAMPAGNTDCCPQHTAARNPIA